MMERGMNVQCFEGLVSECEILATREHTWDPPVWLPLPLPAQASTHYSPESAGFRFDFR